MTLKGTNIINLFLKDCSLQVMSSNITLNVTANNTGNILDVPDGIISGSVAENITGKYFSKLVFKLEVTRVFIRLRMCI